jgi:hypothetical protein
VHEDTLFWGEQFAKIVPKAGGKLIPFQAKPGQRELDAALKKQRAEGKPQRGLALKARQIGISTYAQVDLMHDCTLHERCDALTVAHDRETGAKLYRMADTIYKNLPADDLLRPAIGGFKRQREMHFVGPDRDRPFPDSRYLVDTAGEFEAGRGGTYRKLHGSEVAFWPQIMQKLTALGSAIPDDPDTLILLESTANGFNEFKDLWDDAEEGRSDFIAFFWPWWKEPEYRLPFASDTEREAFIVGDGSNPYAEQEPELVAAHKLELEQLHWRRRFIANKCGGDIRVFHQEMPSTPHEAFVATGQKVFLPERIEQLFVRIDLTDPKQPDAENPGPLIGDFVPERMAAHINRSGDSIQVPEAAEFRERERGLPNPTHPFKLWLPEDLKGREFIMGVDVSGGNTETTKESDYHAIEVIDHRTREQVAEYRSRIETEELATFILLAALYFNNAWVAIERTGGWGMPVLRILYHDFHYPFIYRAKKIGNVSEKAEHRLGWDTTQRTKPEMVSNLASLLKEEEDGIKSRALAGEARTYTRTDKGTTEAEPGKFDDLLSAYMIAQQVARERPLMESGASSEGGFVARPHNISGYDTRLR